LSYIQSAEKEIEELEKTEEDLLLKLKNTAIKH
jgi:hypothetical protein